MSAIHYRRRVLENLLLPLDLKRRLAFDDAGESQSRSLFPGLLRGRKAVGGRGDLRDLE
jgi:hypothetical protein